MLYIKLEVTNSVNDNKGITWFKANTQEEIDKWVKLKDKERDKWNYNTHGAVSTRYYSYERYSETELLDNPVETLEGLTLRDIQYILKI